ncbi:hypothetical protein HK102_013418 [Quaeritorhiza haematococci]|nr:hypothetical protein HK102_013418 [Quaeritorhiza haematococci]
MDDLLSSYTSQIRELQTLSLLRSAAGLVPSSTTATPGVVRKFDELNQVLSDLERRVDKLKDRLQREQDFYEGIGEADAEEGSSGNVGEMEAGVATGSNSEQTSSHKRQQQRLIATQILAALDAFNAEMEHMLKNLPKHLPHVPLQPHPQLQQPLSTTTLSANPLGHSQSTNRQLANNRSSHPGGNNQERAKETSAASVAETGNKGSQGTGKNVPCLIPISVAEFTSLPKYLVGRLTRDKLNDSLSELNKIYATKSRLLRIPQASMSPDEKDRYWEHQRLVTDETKVGTKVFITDKDIKELGSGGKSGSSFKLDPTGRNIISMIRHLGRIKEVRGNGVTRRVPDPAEANRSSASANPQQNAFNPKLQQEEFEEQSISQPTTTSESAKFAAFAARTGLKFDNPQLLVEALTHKSYRKDPDNVNDRLAFLGERVLNLYATEYIHLKYPKLPVDAIESAVNAYVGLKASASVGLSFGVQNVMRWKLESASRKGENYIMAKVVHALVGALYEEKGAKATRNFVHAHFLSRSLDMSAHLKMTYPRHVLLAVTEKLGKPRPVARILKETGRLSSNPVFVVGIYCGTELVGEGYGYSKEMAEIKAVKDSLQKHFLQEVNNITLPSDIDDQEYRISFLEN